jgi:pimeloyl-ACP methyl ester carboxylesterase
MAIVNKPDIFKSQKPEDFNLKSESITIRSEEGFRLKAYLIHAFQEKVKGTVLLIHGIRGRKERYLPSSAFLAENGYNSLVVDLRAHGESQGDFCTFGSKEKKDISLWIDELENRLGKEHTIGIWGNSLGGAVAIQSLEFDSRLSFGIIESTFSDLKSTIHDYMLLNFGFDFPRFTDFLINRAGDIAEFDIYEVKPKDSVEHINQAVLMVHGEEDDHIDISYARMNFKRLLSRRKRFLSIPKANHTDLWEVGGKAYFKQILGFLNKQVLLINNQIQDSKRYGA